MSRPQAQEATCPNVGRHTPMPRGYIAWHELAHRRDRAGQTQVRCVGCGLYEIWTGGRSIPDWPRRPRKP